MRMVGYVGGMLRGWLRGWLGGWLLAVWVLAGGVGVASAQGLVVDATVNETTVGLEETVAYTVEVRGTSIGSLRTPEPPATEGLVLLQAVPTRRSNLSLINGRMQQRVAFTWLFRPVREGQARIGVAEVVVDGETYRTRPITLRIVPQTRRPSTPGQTTPYGTSPDRTDRTIDASDLFIRAIPSKQQVYQGEQVLVEYQLFFRDGVQLRQSRLTDAGDADGFWREELDVDARPVPRSVVENGLRYNMITLKRVAVFPARSGTLLIEPLRIQTEAYVPFNRGDPFERFFSLRSQYQPVELASPALRIDVRPLPEPAPPGFTGAVGQFTLDAGVDRTEVEVGEAVQLRVTLSGTGNIATLEAPPFEPPGIFEQYDPEVSTSVIRSGREVRGARTFTYVLVPRSNGRFELPPLSFTYFDPEAGRYETQTAPAQTIRVTGTAASPLASGTTAEGLPVDDIADLKATPTRWVALGRTPLHERPLVYVALLLPLLLLAGLYGVQRRAARLAADVGYARRRRAHPLARRHLKQAEAYLASNQPRAFYEEVARAVQGFIGNRLNLPERGLTRTRLDDQLAARGVPDEVRQTLRAFLDECDQARFSPVLPDQEAMASACDRAAGLIIRLDQMLAREVAVS